MTKDVSPLQPVARPVCLRQRWWHVAALVVTAAALGAVWWAVDCGRAISFWRVADDYPRLGLAQAINLESWATHGGPRPVGVNQVAHPGLPFQAVNWVCLRVAGLVRPSAGDDPVRSALRDPEPFWLVSQYAALLIGLAGTVGVWWQARRAAPAFALAAVLAFFTFLPAWNYGLLWLTNDTFALPLAVVFFAVAGRAFLSEQSGWSWWSLFGALGGLALLVKLPYVAWPVAAALGLLTQLVVREIGLRRFALRAAAFAGGFAASVAGLGGLLLGPQGLVRMFEFHWGVTSHTGEYGGGEPGLFTVRAVLRNGYHIALRPDLWVVSALLLLLTAAVLWRNRSDSSWWKRQLPLAVCLVGAVVLGYLATLKHFGEHYLLVAAAVLPALVLWLAEAGGRWLGRGLAVAVVLAVCFAGKLTFDYRAHLQAYAEGMRASEQAIDALPRTEGQVRIWTYRVDAAPFIAHWVASMSPPVEDHLATADELFPGEVYGSGYRGIRVFYHGQWSPPAETLWEYAVFARWVYPKFGDLPAYFQENGREVEGFDQVLVVARVKYP